MGIPKVVERTNINVERASTLQKFQNWRRHVIGGALLERGSCNIYTAGGGGIAIFYF